VVAACGFGASYALADNGHGHEHHGAVTTGTTSTTTTTAKGPSCRHMHVRGTVAAPQTLTVTVVHGGGKDAPANGQVVTVTLGSSGQTVNVDVEGCLNGSSLTANQAVLHVEGKHGRDEGEKKTTTTTATTTTTHS
jgi:hypothetical protein